MDNKNPITSKQYLCRNKLKLKIFPPSMHMKNRTEKEFGTFKDHFVEGLATVYT